MYTDEEKLEHAKAWIEALESGKYEQCTGGLRSENGKQYCCLGVACDISNLGEFEMPQGVSYYMPVNGDRGNKHIPEVVSNYYPDFNPYQLVLMNDAKGKSFKEIAAYLRECFGL